MLSPASSSHRTIQDTTIIPAWRGGPKSACGVLRLDAEHETLRPTSAVCRLGHMMQEQTGQDLIENLIRIRQLEGVALIERDRHLCVRQFGFRKRKHRGVSIKSDDMGLGMPLFDQDREGRRATTKIQHVMPRLDVRLLHARPLEDRFTRGPADHQIIEGRQPAASQSRDINSACVSHGQLLAGSTCGCIALGAVT